MTEIPGRFTIAIDGPAGAGKSTVGERLAKRLHAVYFDTGVLYRAVTLAALRRNIPPDDADALAELAGKLVVAVKRPSCDDGRQSDVLIDGEDVTWEIRSASVDHNVSEVSAHPGVRAALLDAQRRIGRSGRVVMVGRDIGTAVLPDAEVKIYLLASLQERARRRYEQLRSAGSAPDFDEILEEMRRRDRIDSERAASPLRPAADAVLVDTDGCSIDDVVDRIAAIAEVRLGDVVEAGQPT